MPLQDTIDLLEANKVGLTWVGREYKDYRFKEITKQGRAAFQVEWSTGGASGGSCWGGEATEYASDEVEPEFTSFDNALEVLCPSITFLQYKKLSKAVVEVDTYTRNDYYGNYTNYMSKTVYLDDLLTTLEEMGLVK